MGRTKLPVELLELGFRCRRKKIQNFLLFFQGVYF